MDVQRRQMMTTQLKISKGEINSLNRYGIADAARTRITAQILRNVLKPAKKPMERGPVPKISKEQNQT